MGRTQRRRRHLKFHVTNFKKKSPQTTDLQGLYRYMIAMGWCNGTNLSVRHFYETGRGLCSKTEHFEPDQVIISMPLRCLTTLMTLEDDADFRTQFNAAAFNRNERVPFQSLMALFLLHQRHRSTESTTGTTVSSYLDFLPDEFTMPHFCAPNELKCLPETIVNRIVEQNRIIHTSFKNLRAAFASVCCACCDRNYFDDLYSMDCFRWAFFVINTRSVYVDSRQFVPSTNGNGEHFFQPLLSDSANMALAPFFDLFNHSDKTRSKAKLVRLAGGELEFVVTTGASFRRCEQIFISYGALSNYKLLTEYGFSLERNAHDDFTFTLNDIECLIRWHKDYSKRTYHQNKFRCIRDHNLDDQMFVDASNGISHNLRVVLHLLFNESSHFPNVLNQVASGNGDQLQPVDEEACALIEFKIKEYSRLLSQLRRLPRVTGSGGALRDYMLECVRFLKECLHDVVVSCDVSR